MTSTSSIAATTDRVTIHDGLSVNARPADFWRRFLAYCVDLGVVSAVLYLAVIVLIIVFALVGVTAAAAIAKMSDTLGAFFTIGIIIMASLLFLSLAAFYHGYFIYFESKNGVTPGKRLFGLKVVTTSGLPLSVWQCVLRDFMRYIDCMLILPGIISFFSTKRNQRLGDLMADTLVVHSLEREATYHSMYLDKPSFDQLGSILKVEPIDADLVRQFQGFVFKKYSRPEMSDPQSDKFWYQLLSSKVSGPLPTDQEVFMRFMAEYFFQHSRRFR